MHIGFFIMNKPIVGTFFRVERKHSQLHIATIFQVTILLEGVPHWCPLGGTSPYMYLWSSQIKELNEFFVVNDTLMLCPAKAI
jgi:hypothetical protein